MEVFIRDEETKWDISYSLADSNNSLDCKDHKPIIVKSLDQHDAETKTPLEDEIERLKNKLADLTEEYELTVEGFDREYATQNVQLRKAFNERNSERLKVIAELEEWVEKASNNYISKFDINGQDALFLVKQKLKEMKG